MSQREFLTVRDAARVAGVHPNTVRAWLRDGVVRAELSQGRNGPTYRIPLEEVVGRGGGAGGPGAPSGMAGLLDRLARVEDERVEEARARAGAEARLEELDDLRGQLEEARAEIRSLRAALAAAMRAGKE